MRHYMNNVDTCRRYSLFSDFEGYEHNVEIPVACLWCDICKTIVVVKSVQALN